MFEVELALRQLDLSMKTLILKLNNMNTMSLMFELDAKLQAVNEKPVTITKTTKLWGLLITHGC